MAATNPNDPGNADLSSRLVGGIKAAIGEKSPPAVTEADTITSPRRRGAFIVAALFMLALWCWLLVPAIESWNDPRADGFQLIPAFRATVVLLPLSLIALLGGISGRGRYAARANLVL